MKHIPGRKLGLALAASATALLAFVALAFWNAGRALRLARSAVEKQDSIHFTVAPLDRTLPADFEAVGAAAGFSDAAFFNHRLYLSGPGGLWEYSPDGRLTGQYRVGMELPSAPIAGLSVGIAADATQPELYLATSGAGLLAVGEKGIRQILPEPGPDRQLTAVLPLPTGRLLLGTAAKGVLVYDGKNLKPFHPLLSGLQVTALAGDEANFWVGTVNRGALHFHGGEVDAFAEVQGLPDPRVLSIAVDGARAFVGTPLGVAEFVNGHFNRVLASGFFANAVLVRRSKLLVGTLDEGVVAVPLGRGTPMGPQAAGPNLPGPVERLVANGDKTYALTGNNFFELDTHSLDWRAVLAGDDAPLSYRNISALAFDAAGRLWVGYFDHGLDILNSALQRVTHIENDNVFCVNRIVQKAGDAGMAVATANGLVMFDAQGRERQVLGRRDGLIADQVSDVAFTPEGMALATSAGITTLTPAGARSIYAFQGLVNNHVYTLASSGSRVLAGTLGGLSILDQGRVTANFTTANSGLRHNWITAIVPVDNDWFVGTYGAGILRFDAAGNWQTFDVASGPFVVNDNAMVATPSRVYAGTMDRGLCVFDRASGRWSIDSTSLPSLNVQALAWHDGYIYVGTDNGLVRIDGQDLGGR